MKALIFDVDGTLAETEELHRRAFNDAFQEFNLNWNWSESDYRWLLKTTGGKERMHAFAKHKNENLSSNTIKEIHIWKTKRYGDLVAQGALNLRKGIRELITFARAQNLKIAVATTTNLPNVDALSLSCFAKPASEIFDAIAAGDMVKSKKPAPDVYQLALKKLNLQASECLAFEDTLNGVNSAKAAGIPVVLSHGFYSKGEENGAADFVVDEFDEVFNIPIFKALHEHNPI